MLDVTPEEFVSLRQTSNTWITGESQDEIRYNRMGKETVFAARLDDITRVHVCEVYDRVPEEE